MRPIGFSTGALALGDFHVALAMLAGAPVQSVELSALRTEELAPLAEAADSLRVDAFRHVSVHAPSRFRPEEEPEIVALLRTLAERWPIVVHPDAIHSFSAWREFGPQLWIENMDKRKPIGRSAEELQRVYERLPEAGLCLDLAHARQYDPSMVEVYRILRQHGRRMRQVHLSEVSTSSRHSRLSWGAIRDFADVAHSIPTHVPIILESPVPASEIEAEVARAREALPEVVALSA